MGDWQDLKVRVQLAIAQALRVNGPYLDTLAERDRRIAQLVQDKARLTREAADWQAEAVEFRRKVTAWSEDVASRTQRPPEPDVETVPNEWPWTLMSCPRCGRPAPGNIVRVGSASRGSIATRCTRCGAHGRARLDFGDSPRLDLE